MQAISMDDTMDGFATGLCCQSCGAVEDLVMSDEPDELVYCRECRSPLRYLDFPDDYCDLGGGD